MVCHARVSATEPSARPVVRRASDTGCAQVGVMDLVDVPQEKIARQGLTISLPHSSPSGGSCCRAGRHLRRPSARAVLLDLGTHDSTRAATLFCGGCRRVILARAEGNARQAARDHARDLGATM